MVVTPIRAVAGHVGDVLQERARRQGHIGKAAMVRPRAGAGCG